MATWILFIHLLFPTPAAEAAAVTDSADAGLRYRGLEAMFARFEAEADADAG